MFANPKTDFAFKRIFGDVHHKGLLIQFLDSLLEHDSSNLIEDIEYLPPEQNPVVKELKFSVVDVKCRDKTGRYYVIEMQIVQNDFFEHRVVYNANKSYVNQLKATQDYRELCDVYAISICDFAIWDEKIPMLSRWQMHEKHTGLPGLAQVQYVFLELSKYDSGKTPESLVEKWAYFFKEAPHLEVIPSFLQEKPFLEAFEVANTANFNTTEQLSYEKSLDSDRVIRGVKAEGHAEGKAEGRAEAQAELARRLQESGMSNEQIKKLLN